MMLKLRDIIISVIIHQDKSTASKVQGEEVKIIFKIILEIDRKIPEKRNCLKIILKQLKEIKD